MSKKNNISIIKASGEVVPFSTDKLRESLRRAGASESETESVMAEISPRLFEGISTKKIYKLAFNLLKGISRPHAAKYHLKGAIMELGPSGYPFEKYIAELLMVQGYAVTTGQVVAGQCVNHEIDVIAQKDHHHFMIECKYHNLRGTICDVKIPLYIQARFKDVEAVWTKIPGHAQKFHQGWVVTNTRFTADAIKYGLCAGLRLIGWDYPNGGSLRGMIDTLGLYPITCLTTLTKAQKQVLLDKRIVLCRDILQNKTLLQAAGVKPQRIDTVMIEVRQLCSQAKKVVVIK